MLSASPAYREEAGAPCRFVSYRSTVQVQDRIFLVQYNNRQACIPSPRCPKFPVGKLMTALISHVRRCFFWNRSLGARRSLNQHESLEISRWARHQGRVKLRVNMDASSGVRPLI